MILEWHPADWQPEETTEVELSFEPIDTGARVTLEHRGWGGLLGDRGGEAVGWFAAEAAAPLLQAMAPTRFAEWLTDRVARRPSGGQAREVYRDPLFHRPNFGALLELLSLGQDDYLLEVGCGGGAFLCDALESGCRAAAVDHSPEMVRLAREVNAETIAAGRLDVVESSAKRSAAVRGRDLHVRDDDRRPRIPLRARRNARRDPARARAARTARSSRQRPDWRGTPAAPEPFASRIRFYTDAELERFGGDAGFADVRVERHDLEPYAREAGIPEEYLPLFAEGRAPFLVARKP